MDNHKYDGNDRRVEQLKSKFEVGEALFKENYNNKYYSLKSRINYKLAAKIPFKTYPLSNVRPMLTFTFDDISESAAVFGAEMLEDSNAHGTFYITTSMLGEHLTGSLKANAEDLQRLHANGHEIALHTHVHLPIFSYSKQGLLADISENKRALNEIIPGLNAENFCYPYGAVTLGHKYNLRHHVRSSRSIEAKVNKGKIDPHFLLSHMIDADCIDADMLKCAFAEANAPHSWLILTSHQVSRRREKLSTTPEILKLALKLAKELDFDIVTIDQALNKLNVPKIGRTNHA